MGGGLHVFNIGDIPVRVSLWYGLLLIFFFQSGGSPRQTLLWAAVVTISILVHELGHAFVARHYRLRPGILLHGLGGLCHHDRAERDRHDVFIIAAGPGAGLLLGFASWLFWVLAPGLVAQHVWLYTVLYMSMLVNIAWSLINLLPMWPLDGGQLFRLAMLRVAKPKRAEQITHYTALAVLAVAFVVGYANDSMLLVILALWIGWSNIQALSGNSASGPIRSQSKHAKQLLEQAKAAYSAEDFKEAARLGHLLRQANVTEEASKQTFRILGVSSARIGDHENALGFLKRAATTPDVVEARIECLFALGRDPELLELLGSDDFQKIAPTRREEILTIVREGQTEEDTPEASS